MRGIETRLKWLEERAGEMHVGGVNGRNRVTLRCLGGVEHAVQVVGSVSPRDSRLPIANDVPAYKDFVRETMMAMSRIFWPEPQRPELAPGEPEPPPLSMLDEMWDTPHFDPALEKIILRHRAIAKAAYDAGRKAGPGTPEFAAALGEVRRFVDDALADNRWEVES